MAILQTRVAVMAVAALVVVGGACGGGNSGAEEARHPTSLDAALGMDPAAIQERERKVQEAVRACMQAEGFEYVPVDPSQSNMMVITPGSQDTSEFRRTKGYGVSTTFDDAPAGDAGSTDPNQKIRESLSDEQKKAYDVALFGKAASEHGRAGGGFAITIGPGAAGDADSHQAPSLEESGCFGKAQQQVEGGPARFDEMGPRLQELEQRIEADPRMVKANAAWSTCMSKAGHSFDKPEDIMSYLFQRMQELTAAGGDRSAQAGVMRPGARTGAPPVDEAELAELQQEELSIARADDDCSEKSGRRATAKKVRAELEKQFLEDHPDLGGA